jgi:hypothetical protein
MPRVPIGGLEVNVTQVLHPVSPATKRRTAGIRRIQQPWQIVRILLVEITPSDTSGLAAILGGMHFTPKGTSQLLHSHCRHSLQKAAETAEEQFDVARQLSPGMPTNIASESLAADRNSRRSTKWARSAQGTIRSVGRFLGGIAERDLWKARASPIGRKGPKEEVDRHEQSED